MKRAIVTFTLLAGLATPLCAQGGWSFDVAPYLLAPHMNGTSSVLGQTIDVDSSPSDIFNSLDFGAMLYLEASNGVWAFSLDGIYMDLGEDGQLPITGRAIEVDIRQLAIEGAVLRRVTPWAEVGAGVLLNSIKRGLYVAPGDSILPGQDQSATDTWVDPAIVARLEAPLEGAWRLGFKGEVGGFGLGSDLLWQVRPVVGYRFSRLFEFSLAYRAISVDYESGSGTDRFVYDVVTFGPEIGFIFKF